MLLDGRKLRLKCLKFIKIEVFSRYCFDLMKLLRSKDVTGDEVIKAVESMSKA